MIILVRLAECKKCHAPRPVTVESLCSRCAPVENNDDFEEALAKCSWFSNTTKNELRGMREAADAKVLLLELNRLRRQQSFPRHYQYPHAR